MFRSLRAVLLDPPGRLSRHELQALLSKPGISPADPFLRKQAEALCGPLTPSEFRGTLGVAVHSGHTTLIEAIAPSREQRDDGVFYGQALESMDRARALALQSVPLVRRLDRAEELQMLRVRWLCSTHTPPSLFDGPSFGLAFALYFSSRLMQVSVPSDLLATVALEPDGTLAPVGDLEQKLRFLYAFALGIRRIVVHKDQRERAQRFLAERDDGRTELPAVLGFDRLSCAIDELLGTAGGTLPDDPTKIEEELLELRRQVLRGFGRPVRWEAVAASAKTYKQHLTEPSRLGIVADQVLCIANRHAGRTENILLPWPEDSLLREMPRPQRLRYLAQVVQSAADESDEKARAHLLAVLRWLPSFPIENTLQDLELLGAIGRAWSSIGEYAQAAAVLCEALQGWFANDEGALASYALCEYLRVLSLCERPEVEVPRAVDEWLPRFASCVDATPRSHAYVALAAGRALVLAAARAPAPQPQLLERARRLLSPLIDELNLPTGQRMWAALRWWLRAVSPEEREIYWERQKTLSSTDPELARGRILAQLDQALASGEELSEVTAKVLENEFLRKEFERMRKRVGKEVPRDLWEQLAAEYRY